MRTRVVAGGSRGGLAASPQGASDRISTKLLILLGISGPVTPQGQLRAFEEQLQDTEGLDWQWVTHSGAMHAFTVPSANDPEHGVQYDEHTDRRSRAALKLFLSELLG